MSRDGRGRDKWRKSGAKEKKKGEVGARSGDRGTEGAGRTRHLSFILTNWWTLTFLYRIFESGPRDVCMEVLICGELKNYYATLD